MMNAFLRALAVPTYTLTSALLVASVANETSGPGGKLVGPVGFVVNCPVIAVVDGPR